MGGNALSSGIVIGLFVWIGWGRANRWPWI